MDYESGGEIGGVEGAFGCAGAGLGIVLEEQGGGGVVGAGEFNGGGEDS